jgi:hypothetical protein
MGMMNQVEDLAGRLRALIVAGAKLRDLEIDSSGRPNATAVAESMCAAAKVPIITRQTIWRVFTMNNKAWRGDGVVEQGLLAWHGGLDWLGLQRLICSTEPIPPWRATRGAGPRGPQKPKRDKKAKSSTKIRKGRAQLHSVN